MYFSILSVTAGFVEYNIPGPGGGEISDFGLAYGVEEKSPVFLAFKVSLRVAREEMQQFVLKLAQISRF